MRILHVHSGNIFGGVESHLLAMLGEPTPPLVHEVALCFEAELAERWRALGGLVHPLGAVRLSRPLSVLRVRRRLREVIAARRPDFLMTHSTWGLTVFGRELDAAPLAHCVHGAVAGTSMLDRLAMRRQPRVVVSNSQFTSHGARHLFPRTRHVVVHPAVSFAEHHDRAQIRALLGTPEDRFVVTVVARIEEGKGHDLLLDALSKLPSTLDWECWIVGGASETRRGLVHDLQGRASARFGLRVRWLGHRQDVSGLMAGSDVVCLPNRVPEGFGIVLVEALAQDIPVVTIDHGGAREILSDPCGVLSSEDDASLAQAILHAGRLLPLDGAGRARAESLCDAMRVQRELQRALEEES